MKRCLLRDSTDVKHRPQWRHWGVFTSVLCCSICCWNCVRSSVMKPHLEQRNWVFKRFAEGAPRLKVWSCSFSCVSAAGLSDTSPCKSQKWHNLKWWLVRFIPFVFVPGIILLSVLKIINKPPSPEPFLSPGWMFSAFGRDQDFWFHALGWCGSSTSHLSWILSWYPCNTWSFKRKEHRNMNDFLVNWTKHSGLWQQWFFCSNIKILPASINFLFSIMVIAIMSSQTGYRVERLLTVSTWIFLHRLLKKKNCDNTSLKNSNKGFSQLVLYLLTWGNHECLMSSLSTHI